MKNTVEDKLELLVFEQVMVILFQGSWMTVSCMGVPVYVCVCVSSCRLLDTVAVAIHAFRRMCTSTSTNTDVHILSHANTPVQTCSHLYIYTVHTHSYTYTHTDRCK